MPPLDMKELARRGADARAHELQQELEAIYDAFPELRQSRRRGPAAKVIVNREEQSGRSASALAAKEPAVANTPRRGKRRNMTAAERKAVSERMRKYWASRRAESATKKR